MNKYRNYSDEESLYTQDYMDHVQAMTAEKLHSKSEIAAELAGRDREIEQLKIYVNELREVAEDAYVAAFKTTTSSWNAEFVYDYQYEKLAKEYANQLRQKAQEQNQ